MQIDIENIEEYPLLEDFENAYNQVKDAVHDFLGEQGEHYLHDLRSSLRRLDAVIHLLPKEARNAYPAISKYRKRCKELLQLSSPVRDIDVVSAALQKLAPEQYRPFFYKRLKTTREKYLVGVLKHSWTLFERHLPEMDTQYFKEVGQYSEKVTENLEASISKKFSQALESESNKDAMHKLRKKCKKLRYTLELLPYAPARSKSLALMRELQDRLGAILEHDVIIDYLRDLKPTGYITDIIQKESKERHEGYARFVDDFRNLF